MAFTQNFMIKCTIITQLYNGIDTCNDYCGRLDGVKGGVGEGEQVIHPPQVRPLGHVQVTAHHQTKPNNQ
jgi:hypothetical protein